MRVLLKTIKQIKAEDKYYYGGSIVLTMVPNFGKFIELYPTEGDDPLYEYFDADDWGYKKEWIVWDHDLLKALRRCINQE